MPPAPAMGQPTPPATPPKKSNLGLIIGIIAGVLLIAAVIVIIVLMSDKSDSAKPTPNNNSGSSNVVDDKENNGNNNNGGNNSGNSGNSGNNGGSNDDKKQGVVSDTYKITIGGKTMTYSTDFAATVRSAIDAGFGLEYTDPSSKTTAKASSADDLLNVALGESSSVYGHNFSVYGTLDNARIFSIYVDESSAEEKNAKTVGDLSEPKFTTNASYAGQYEINDKAFTIKKTTASEIKELFGEPTKTTTPSFGSYMLMYGKYGSLHYFFNISESSDTVESFTIEVR